MVAVYPIANGGSGQITTTGAYTFVGTKAVVNTTATQRISGSVSVTLYNAGSTDVNAAVFLCYGSAQFPMPLNSVGAGTMGTIPAGGFVLWTASSSHVPGAMNSWQVGLCASLPSGATVSEQAMTGYFFVTE